jgi:tetratricopeptide (TPR) repeat protein
MCPDLSLLIAAHIALNVILMTFQNDMRLAQQKLQSGQHKHALRAAKSAMKKGPRSPFPLNFAGIALGGMGKHREAVVQFKKALKLDPQCRDARKNLAQSLILLDDPGTAKTVLAKLTEQTPEDAGVWYLLAQANAKLGKPEDAEQAATKSIERAPNLARAYNLRALAREQMGQIVSALDDYKAALDLNPNDIDSLINVSLPLARQSRYDEAMQAITRAVELAPDNIDARMQMAMQLVAKGDYAKGIENFSHVLKIDPKHSEAIEQLADMPAKDQLLNLEQLAQIALKTAPKKSKERIRLCFALSKIAEKAGRQSEADTYLASANQNMAALRPYNAKADSTQIGQLLARFMKPIETKPANSPTPVYIVGLPRSGTSLCEAIIGAHPHVSPFGERTAAGVLLKDIIQDDRPFDDAAIQVFTAKDKDLLPDLPDGTIAYVDKMPENYRLLGFLGTAYPHCRIINLRRDPRDIALSMWRGNFAGSALSYTYGLQSMAHRFNLYAKAMIHWRKVMPGFILDMRYEDMVGDIERSSHVLADFCGIDWTLGMTRPDLNAEQVLTMSATQLRQPVHSRSVGKWRQHEAVLAPFIEKLDPVLWPEIAG